MFRDISPRDWGAFVVSLIFLSFFGAYESAILFWKIPKDDTLASILNNLTVLVAGYWIGSSRSSQTKDATTAAQAELIAKLSKPTGEPQKPSGELHPLPVILVAATLLLAAHDHAWAASHKAALNCGLPHPDPGCTANGGVVIPPTSPLGAIASWTIDDLNGAADLAGRIGDTAGGACFRDMADSITNLGDLGVPVTLKLATDYEKLWAIHMVILQWKADAACQAVCGRLPQVLPMIGKVGVNLCDILNLAR